MCMFKQMNFWPFFVAIISTFNPLSVHIFLFVRHKTRYKQTVKCNQKSKWSSCVCVCVCVCVCDVKMFWVINFILPQKSLLNLTCMLFAFSKGLSTNGIGPLALRLSASWYARKRPYFLKWMNVFFLFIFSLSLCVFLFFLVWNEIRSKFDIRCCFMFNNFWL